MQCIRTGPISDYMDIFCTVTQHPKASNSLIAELRFGRKAEKFSIKKHISVIGSLRGALMQDLEGS